MMQHKKQQKVLNKGARWQPASRNNDVNGNENDKARLSKRFLAQTLNFQP